MINLNRIRIPCLLHGGRIANLILTAVLLLSLMHVHKATTAPSATPTSARSTMNKIVTVGGTGTQGSTGTGSSISAATLNSPRSIWQDSQSTFYVGEQGGNCVRKFSTSNIVVAVAGVCGSSSDYAGDGGPATSALFNSPVSSMVDTLGQVFICDLNNHLVRKVTTAAKISIVTGTQAGSNSGDGGPATAASFYLPCGIWFNSVGLIYVTSTYGHVVRSISANGIINLFAGVGVSAFYGNTWPATSAGLSLPERVYADSTGVVYISSSNNHKVRTVSISNILYNFFGDGNTAFDGNDLPATSFSMYYPTGIAVDPDNGDVYVAARLGARLFVLTESTGLGDTFAGTGVTSSTGDNGAPTSATLSGPDGVYLDSNNVLYFTEFTGHKLRKIYTIQPTVVPTLAPTTTRPTILPSVCPTLVPSFLPSPVPSRTPSALPSLVPSRIPTTIAPTPTPSVVPSLVPSCIPTTTSPTKLPSLVPTLLPSVTPSLAPSRGPTLIPSAGPTVTPSLVPTALPTFQATIVPTMLPTTIKPTVQPTVNTIIPSPRPSLSMDPSIRPTLLPSVSPQISFSPTVVPTVGPSCLPTIQPTVSPTVLPSVTSTLSPSVVPTLLPSSGPTVGPSCQPSVIPTVASTTVPSLLPSVQPSLSPSTTPTIVPSIHPTTQPSVTPTVASTIPPSPAPVSGPSMLPTTQPSPIPTVDPTTIPSVVPSVAPTCGPSVSPSMFPTVIPTAPTTESPTQIPNAVTSVVPTVQPSLSPTLAPSINPSMAPSLPPTFLPTTATEVPSVDPSLVPTMLPSVGPSDIPSIDPSLPPSTTPSITPTTVPSPQPASTVMPSVTPSQILTESPSTLLPTISPSAVPSLNPSIIPSVIPSPLPSAAPSESPSIIPSLSPTQSPTVSPSLIPSDSPSLLPTLAPSQVPSLLPSVVPTTSPSVLPSCFPSLLPTSLPTVAPTVEPSILPSRVPSANPTFDPSVDPSVGPSLAPTVVPSLGPSILPTIGPTVTPSLMPSQKPTMMPTAVPSVPPSVKPSVLPSRVPSLTPSIKPTGVPALAISQFPTSPTVKPTNVPTVKPSIKPTRSPSVVPSIKPTEAPSVKPSTSSPTLTVAPSAVPTVSLNPSVAPSIAPSVEPTIVPTCCPSAGPTSASPTAIPSLNPTAIPSTVEYYVSHPKATLPSNRSISVIGDTSNTFRIVLPFLSVYGGTAGTAFNDINLNAVNSGLSYLVEGSRSLPDSMSVVSTTSYSGAYSLDSSKRSVSALGDVNGDGFDDLIIGDPYSAACYVLFGNVQGLTSMMSGFTIFGERAADLTGWSVSGAGDVNNDTVADIIVGAPFANSVGAFYVIYGRKIDNFDVYLNNLTVSKGFAVYGSQRSDYLGIAVSFAGDVNKDQCDDVVVGAVMTSGYFTGAVYVVFGCTITVSSMATNQLSLSQGFKAVGPSYSYVGYSVSAAGDVNGDGFDDVVIGSSPQRSSLSLTSYILWGTSSVTANIVLSTMTISEGVRVVGGGVFVSAAGDVNHDGLSDVFVSAAVMESQSIVGYIVYSNTSFLTKMTSKPSTMPTGLPLAVPSMLPSRLPTFSPSLGPSKCPSLIPSLIPTAPTFMPTIGATAPTSQPSSNPTFPTISPSCPPTESPTVRPSEEPSENPTAMPSNEPSESPTKSPSAAPSLNPTIASTISPSTVVPTVPALTRAPFSIPTLRPTNASQLPRIETYVVSTTGEVVNQMQAGINYVVNASGHVTIHNTAGSIKYTIVANPQSLLTIITLNSSSDVIDLTLIQSLESYGQLNLTEGSVLITLPDQQKIHILNLHLSDISVSNFLFYEAPVPQSSTSKTVSKLALAVGISVSVLGFLFLSVVSYQYYSSKLKAKAVTLLRMPNHYLLTVKYNADGTDYEEVSSQDLNSVDHSVEPDEFADFPNAEGGQVGTQYDAVSGERFAYTNSVNDDYQGHAYDDNGLVEPKLEYQHHGKEPSVDYEHTDHVNAHEEEDDVESPPLSDFSGHSDGDFSNYWNFKFKDRESAQEIV